MTLPPNGQSSVLPLSGVLDALRIYATGQPEPTVVTVLPVRRSIEIEFAGIGDLLAWSGALDVGDPVDMADGHLGQRFAILAVVLGGWNVKLRCIRPNNARPGEPA